MSKRCEVSSIIAVTPAGRIDARHVFGTVRGPYVIRALQHFRSVFAAPLLVAWDRSNTHRDRRVQAFIAAHAADYAV